MKNHHKGGHPGHPRRAFWRRLAPLPVLALLAAGCSAARHLETTDATAYSIIAQKQQQALGRTEPFTIEPPEVQLRRRLLLDQDLPRSGPASLGSRYLEPIDHWPAAPEPPVPPGSGEEDAAAPVDRTITISLRQALQIGALNSQAYQSRKEEVYRAALALDFERDRFRNTFSGQVAGAYLEDRTNADDTGPVTGFEATSSGGVSRLFLNSMSMTARIGLDLARMLEPSRVFSSAIFGDASISIPLLRGAGRHIAAESLTQSERETIYAIWEFERFKKEFAVTIADSYLSVLQAADQVANQEENYRGLITSSRRATRLADAGKMTQLQVDQSVQNELRARDRWVAARQFYQQQLDSFKMLLGLPADAAVLLDRRELGSLESHINRQLSHLLQEEEPQAAVPADAPIVLTPPRTAERGPLEMDPAAAIATGLVNRLDLQVREGRVYDAQRQVVVAADGLRPELNLLGTAALGERRTVYNAGADSENELDFSRGFYQGLLTLDLPLERTAEAIDYRDSYIRLEQAVRDVQILEDRIKFEIRNSLRNLEQARASLKIQYQAVTLAERRVRGAILFLEAGRAEIRDLLEAQESLLAAQNSLTSAMVNYRVAELELQRDTGLLQTDSSGLWLEITPQQEQIE